MRRRVFAHLVEMVGERSSSGTRAAAASRACPSAEPAADELEMKPTALPSTTSADADRRVKKYTSPSSSRFSTYASKMSTYDVDAYPTPGGEEWVAPLLRQNKLDKKRLQKKSIVPIDLEELRKRVCKVLAGGAGPPDSGINELAEFFQIVLY